MGLCMAEALAMMAGTEFMYGVSMSAYLRKNTKEKLCRGSIFRAVTCKNIYPAKAVRATQEYGDHEMTYSRMTINAIFAIFHSFCKR